MKGYWTSKGHYIVVEKIDDLIFFSATDFAEALLPEVPQHKKEETEQAGEEQA